MVRLEDRVLMDAQRAEDARSARLAQVLGRDPGKWLQLAGGFGIALDLLTPPVGMFGLIAAGTGIVGYNASMRRAEELRRLNARMGIITYGSQNPTMCSTAQINHTCPVRCVSMRSDATT
jgi:hypothetical protein